MGLTQELYFQEDAHPHGRLTISILDGKTGQLKDQLVAKNLWVTDGFAYLASLIQGTTPPTHVALGTSNTAPTLADSALVTEVYRDTITQRIKITDGLRVRLFVPTTAANGNTLTEAGIFGPAPTSQMLNRVIYTGIAKDVSIALNYAWDLTFS